MRTARRGQKVANAVSETVDGKHTGPLNGVCGGPLTAEHGSLALEATAGPMRNRTGAWGGTVSPEAEEQRPFPASGWQKCPHILFKPKEGRRK